MSNKKKPFSKDILHIDNIEKVCDQIIKSLKENVYKVLFRRGGVVGISGGIDSSVTLALTAKAFGPNSVLGIMLPEKDSSSDSQFLAKELADTFGVTAIKEEITNALDGFGCYERRDAAVKQVFHEFSVLQLVIFQLQHKPHLRTSMFPFESTVRQFLLLKLAPLVHV